MIKKVELHTDGSCLFNNTSLDVSPGGWCYILRYKDKEKIDKGSEIKTTNNRMEMRAVIEGLKALKTKCDVDFYSDSKYVLDSLASYIYNWRKKEFLNPNSNLANIELWKELNTLFLEKVNNATYTWVKGHDANINKNKDLELARRKNIICDKLAREEAKKIYEKINNNI